MFDDDRKEIVLTKQLQGVLDKYSVKLRKNNSVVTHLVYRKKTECSPVVFAVYEASIKAQFCSWLAVYDDPQWAEIAAMQIRHLRRLAAKDGIKALGQHGGRDGIQWAQNCGKDNSYLTRLIAEAGYYFDLLD